VSLLIPARNEERNIAWVLRRVPDSVDEVVLIDGRSTDRTVAVARSIRPDIVVVPEVGRGKGAAVRTGIETASGTVAVMLDADGSMDPGEIDRYLDAVAVGADLVKGSRFLAGGGTTDMTTVRRLGNRALRDLVNALYGVRHSELCYGYMAFRLEPIRRLGLTADGFEIECELVVRSLLAGLVVAEVPSTETPRLSGESNLNATRDGLRILRTLLWNRVASIGRVMRPGPMRVPNVAAAATAVGSAAAFLARVDMDAEMDAEEDLEAAVG